MSNLRTSPLVPKSRPLPRRLLNNNFKAVRNLDNPSVKEVPPRSSTIKVVEICIESDSDDDVVVEHVEGHNPIYPNDPVLSNGFRNYLRTLKEQDIKLLFEQADTLPLAIKAQRAAQQNCQSDPPSRTSFSYLTSRDLEETVKEEERIIKDWTNKERTTFGFKKEAAFGTQPSIEVVGLHHYLTASIIKAKLVCAKRFRKSLDLNASEEEKKRVNDICEFLFWQYNVTKELYRQTRMIPFMKQKLGILQLSNPSKVRSTRRKTSSTDPVGSILYKKFRLSEPEKVPVPAFTGSEWKETLAKYDGITKGAGGGISLFQG